MRTVWDLVRRLDKPEIEDDRAIYHGFTFAESLKAPLGFTVVDDLCEYPYRIVWVYSDPYSILEYCEHDINLTIFKNESDFTEELSKYLWNFSIPKRIKRATETFKLKTGTDSNGSTKTWYAACSNDAFVEKLHSLGLEVDDYHYEWAATYLSEFNECVDSGRLEEIRDDRDELGTILDEIEEDFVEITYDSEHIDWISYGSRLGYFNDALNEYSSGESFEDICTRAEKKERLEVRDIIKEFLEWLLFDYEEDELWAITNSDTLNALSLTAV